MNPWEAEADFPGAVRAILRDPSAFFRGVERTGPVGRPLAFGILAGTAGTVATILWRAAATLLRAWRGGDADPAVVLLGAGGMCLVAPLAVTIGLLVGSGVTHLALLLVGGARHGFGATLRATSYAQAPELLHVVPVCGSVMAPLWSLWLTVVGLREVHETTTLRALLAVVLPLALCLALVAALALTLLRTFLQLT